MAELTLLERRRLEAGVLVPMIRAMQAEFGEAKVNDVVGRTIKEVARAQGEEARAAGKIDSMAALADASRTASCAKVADCGHRRERRGEIRLQRHALQVRRDVRRVGRARLGFLLSATGIRDVRRNGPELDFDRTQTRMQGASHCDFRYKTPGA